MKEVGQGMGPKSMEALLNLPLEAIEFGAYGGTNFALLELMRDHPEKWRGLNHWRMLAILQKKW